MYFRYRFPIFDSWSKQSGDAGDNTIVPESQLDAESNESETGTTDDNLTSFSPGARNRNLHKAQQSGFKKREATSRSGNVPGL
jgi:serine/threonine protein kinase HipA of HipAB toxin-antitoxin module